jgi:hypothetical protein
MAWFFLYLVQGWMLKADFINMYLSGWSSDQSTVWEFKAHRAITLLCSLVLPSKHLGDTCNQTL